MYLRTPPTFTRLISFKKFGKTTSLPPVALIFLPYFFILYESPRKIIKTPSTPFLLIYLHTPPYLKPCRFKYSHIKSSTWFPFSYDFINTSITFIGSLLANSSVSITSFTLSFFISLLFKVLVGAPKL